MRINHNLQALNSYNRLTSNQASGSKSIAKLSSGLRINSAADDAAGLTISEKMRSQIRGLEQASRNAQDGISLIQTAEGALGESHAILQKMRELAVQSANDTNVDVDRVGLQSEVDQLAQELTRISENTEFNTKKVLDGSFSGKLHIGANKDQAVTFDIGNMSATALKVGSYRTDEDVKITLGTGANSTTGQDTTNLALANAVATVEKLSDPVDIGGTEYNYAIKQGGNYVGVSADGKTYRMVGSGGEAATVDAMNLAATNSENLTFATKIAGNLTITNAGGKSQIAYTETYENFEKGMGLQDGTYTVGGTNNELRDADNNLVATSTDQKTWKDSDGNTLFVSDLNMANGDDFTISGNTYKGTDISKAADANDAIETITSAINAVSAERAKMGATQNRLEHTINNLGASAENMTAAESRIRDVDMAKEMMNFTKNNILTQAAQSMLAQANQAPQGVLQLLR